MFSNGRRRAGAASRPRDRAARPAPEGLERRLLLWATHGGEWAYGSRITYSFAPDGTDVGGTPSALFASLAARGISAESAQEQFKKAAAVWQNVANVNLAMVGDDGSAFGAAGNQQGDPRFGDVRFAATAQDPGVLGLAFLPPPYNGGSLAGDVVMNSGVAWAINSDFDLMTVAVHEIGHSLGMGHSAISSAVMYAAYTGVKQALTTDDSAGIQSVYGARLADTFDAAQSNGSPSVASAISSLLNPQAQATLAGLDVTTAADNDWYYVVAPAGAGSTLTVTMQSSNLSSLSPRVMVYSAGLQLRGQAAAANSYGATVTTTVTGVTAGQGYYIRALAANTGPGSTGSYGLLVNFGGPAMAPVAPPVTTVAAQPDQGGGSLLQQVLGLTKPLLDQLSGGDREAIHEARIGDLRGAGEFFTIDGDEPDLPIWSPPTAGRSAWEGLVATWTTADARDGQDPERPGRRGAGRSARDDHFDRALENWDS